MGLSAKAIVDKRRQSLKVESKEHKENERDEPFFGTQNLFARQEPRVLLFCASCVAQVQKNPAVNCKQLPT